MLPSICSTVSARFIFSSFIEMRKEFQVSHHNESPTSKSTSPCRLRFRRWPSSIFILTTAPRTVITHRSPRPLGELFFSVSFTFFFFSFFFFFFSLSFLSNFTQHALWEHGDVRCDAPNTTDCSLFSPTLLPRSFTPTACLALLHVVIASLFQLLQSSICLLASLLTCLLQWQMTSSKIIRQTG